MADGFGEVYREHVAPVWRHVRSRVPSDADAEDVTSMVFEKAMGSWDRYDPTLGTVGAWLAGITRHSVADWWRKHGREVPAEEPVRDGEGECDPEGEVLRREGADAVRRHLGLLTPREREAVALRFGAELDSTEIGAVMGISPTAARMLVHRGVGRLREVLAHD